MKTSAPRCRKNYLHPCSYTLGLGLVVEDKSTEFLMHSAIHAWLLLCVYSLLSFRKGTFVVVVVKMLLLCMHADMIAVNIVTAVLE